MKTANSSVSLVFRNPRGGGRIHHGLFALGLSMLLFGCTEEVIVVEPAASDDAGGVADSSGPAAKKDGGVDATSPPTDSSVAQPDTSVASTDPSQICVDAINNYRKTLSLPPLQRWNSSEACAGTQGLADSKSGTPHSAFGKCGEWAQNECPGWPGPEGQMITGCLQMMWNEGPGSDFSTHGHYINMSSTKYTKVACGFATASNGSIWAVQDFQ